MDAALFLALAIITTIFTAPLGYIRVAMRTRRRGR